MDKHNLCLSMEEKLAMLIVSISKYKEMIVSNIHLLLSPKLSIPQDNRDLKVTSLAEQLKELEEDLPSIICYIKLRTKDLDNIPTPGENGNRWLKRFRIALHDVREEFIHLQEYMTFFSIALITAINIDTIHHERFFSHYGDSLKQAIEKLSVSLGKNYDDRPTIEWKTKWKEMLAEVTINYYNTLIKIISGAPLMTEDELVSRISRIFKNFLIKLDTTQGSFTLQTYKIISILAKMEMYYQKREYNLTKYYD